MPEFNQIGSFGLQNGSGVKATQTPLIGAVRVSRIGGTTYHVIGADLVSPSIVSAAVAAGALVTIIPAVASVSWRLALLIFSTSVAGKAEFLQDTTAVFDFVTPNTASFIVPIPVDGLSATANNLAFKFKNTQAVPVDLIVNAVYDYYAK